MKTILLGLNELNFNYISWYIKKGHLPNFEKIFNMYGYTETTSEDDYKLLEPWIQWVTVVTGKSYNDHRIFRLGDIVDKKNLKQIFETIEEKGFKVGAVCPFNVDNRLKNPSFFLPDPWTKTKISGNYIFSNLCKAVSQAVNSNSQKKFNFKTFFFVLLAILKYSTFKGCLFYLKNMFCNKSNIGIKAIMLDKLLFDVFIYEWSKHRPDFSNLFLNAGAHLQHHYLFNSKAYQGNLSNPEWYCPSDQDPLFEILKLYDNILEKIIKLPVRIVVATGLHQEPHPELTYYWRLNNHRFFLELIGVENIIEIIPKMSRDFLINFDSNVDALLAANVLESYYMELDGIKIFTVDNRGRSLFVEFVYPNNLLESCSIIGIKKVSNISKYLSFVAIKNGEHNGIGYVLDTENRIPISKFNLGELYNYLMLDFN